MILQPNGKLKQRLNITPVQIAVILGLEPFLEAHGLILVCPQCLAEGDASLQTDNDPSAREFKIDCGCHERRIAAAAVGRARDADGRLVAGAEAALRPLRLSMRCSERRCVAHPLEIEQTPTTTIVRCRCAKTTIHPPSRVTH